MSRIVIILLLLAGRAWGAWEPTDREVAYSQSGQFIVTGRALPPAASRVFRYDAGFKRLFGTGWTDGKMPQYHGARSTNAYTLRLDPNYLVATCERVRSTFNETLQLNEPYRGRVYINLLESAGPEAEITFLSTYDKPKQTWNCKIAMPAEISPDRLLRVLTQALIFEAAHRGAGPGGCEIPLWLSEGMIAHIEARVAETAVFEPNTTVNIFRTPLEEVNQLNGAIGPGSCLTLEQLSWPGTLERKPDVERAFQLSSHALVLELLRLQNGGRCLGQVIRLLPRFQNWQFAFLNGFKSHFPSLLDAEKWWAITSLHIGDKGAFEKWSIAESLRRLDAALVLPVERRESPEGENLREDMDLRTILTSMNFEVQKTMLARVISGLFGLELRAAPRVARLAGDYRSTLEKYVADRDEIRRSRFARLRPVRLPETVVESTLKELETLAELRQDFDLFLPAESTSTDRKVAAFSTSTP